MRNNETLAWNFEAADTELWKEPPDPILEAVAKFITEGNPIWLGTATELSELLGVNLKPNTLSLKLNVTAARLLNNYGIAYKTNDRTHNGRSLTLKRV